MIHTGGRSCRRVSRSGSIWRGLCSKRVGPMPQAGPCVARSRDGIRSSSSSDSCLRALSRWKPAAAPVSGGREIGKPGHDVRLIPPADAKPFVTRQKNDAADAEAICEAAMRPTMRFVPVKSEETRGAAMVFRVRELLIRQRTQAIDALRGHLSEFGRIVPQGAGNAARPIAIVDDPDSGLPADAVPALEVLIAALAHPETEIARLDAEIARRVHASARPGTWLGGMLSRKPSMLVRVALANKMARVVRAFAIGLERMATNGSLARGGVCKSPATAA